MGVSHGRWVCFSDLVAVGVSHGSWMCFSDFIAMRVSHRWMSLGDLISVTMRHWHGHALVNRDGLHWSHCLHWLNSVDWNSILVSRWMGNFISDIASWSDLCGHWLADDLMVL